MPIATQVRKTPNGKDLLHLTFSGRVEEQEVNQNIGMLARGQEHAGKLLLVSFEKGTDLSPEARRAAANLLKPGGQVGPIPAGIVAPNAVLRVIVSFLTKVVGVPGAVHIAANESDALTWLDQVDVKVQKVS
jgi:hypothetical protein